MYKPAAFYTLEMVMTVAVIVMIGILINKALDPRRFKSAYNARLHEL